MNEKLIEKKLREGVKKVGGLALKFYSPYFIGMPDRIVLMPNGSIYWVELKSTGKNLQPIQKSRRILLRKMGFSVSVVDDEFKLHAFLNKIDEERYRLNVWRGGDDEI